MKHSGTNASAWSRSVRGSCSRHLARRVAVTLTVSLLLLGGGPAEAATVGMGGAPGLPGVNGMSPGDDGGNGQNGEVGEAILDAVPPLSETIYETIGVGGNGGRGGNGLGPADGGHGGAGGAGNALSVLNRVAGPATATAHATGGRGGDFGRGGITAVPPDVGTTSGAGGAGGNAVAGAVATTTSADAVRVEAVATGGRAGITSIGIPLFGGSAQITQALGQSAGGAVEVVATATSGDGWSGEPNTNGLFIGPGGHSRDVVLNNVADGVTTGPITLLQEAISGRAGAGFSQLNIAAPHSGDTVSTLDYTRSAQSLDFTATAMSGIGGEGRYASPGGNGGNALARVVADTPVGQATARSNAFGGQGGQVAPLFGILVTQPILLGNGGDGDAFAEARGSVGTITATALATGGTGGFNQPSASSQAPVQGGIGGDAKAEARALDRGANFATADAQASAGGRGSDSGSGPAPGSRGGSADAYAVAESGLRAFAQSDARATGGSALARSQAIGVVADIQARASAGGSDTDFISSFITTVGGNGSVDAIAAAGRSGALVGGSPAPVVNAVTAATVRVPGSLLEIDLFVQNAPTAIGTIFYRSETQFRLQPSLGLPTTLDLTLGTPTTLGSGIDSLLLDIFVEGNPVIHALFSSPAAIQNAFTGMLFSLGQTPTFTPGTLNLLNIDVNITMRVTGAGNGFASSVAFAGALVPLPATFWLLAGAFSTLVGWRREHI